ncbi:MAG: DUF885 domain-containing protein [Acidimicrobiia bacterium]|nr:DUF885 domain-containing protein [Acidimicrobiia bacterium]
MTGLPVVSESAALADLARRYWDHLAGTNPTSALLNGDHRFGDRMEDVTRAAEDDSIGVLEGFAAEAERLDPSELTADESVSRSVLIHEAQAQAGELRSRYSEIAVSSVMGFHVNLQSAAPQFPIIEPEHAEALVDKYRAIGGMFDDAVKRLRQGLARDRTPPAVAVERTIEQIDGYLATALDTDLFLQVRVPEAFDEATERVWRESLTDLVESEIRPAYRRYRDALANEVLSKARPQEKSGVVWLPDGSEVYERAVARHTTLPLTAMDIHRFGLDSIESLADEYRELGGRVLGTTDLPAIFDRLRHDPALRFTDSDAVRAQAVRALDRAREAIPDWFGRLPEADCVVVDIPEVAAKDSTIAYYLQPAADGTRPGSYYINVSEPTTRTVFESEVLAFHESIPGHHLQIAIAQELDGIPEFRRHAWITAYGEGWGLYTERLSDEMGMYSGDMERLGILSFDSWRACRLVVDTGMHALGWSRREAIDYLMENSPQAPNNIVNEVDRYIAWPGQALAYKIGQREIMRLRDRAQSSLGPRFDIKAFHDTVLGSGPVPLPVLGRLVDAWAAS